MLRGFRCIGQHMCEYAHIWVAQVVASFKQARSFHTNKICALYVKQPSLYFAHD